jgi:hypothetical protein
LKKSGLTKRGDHAKQESIPLTEYFAGCSVPDAFHILKQDLLTTTIIEFGSTAIGVPGNALGGFERAVIFEEIRDTGRPE